MRFGVVTRFSPLLVLLVFLGVSRVIGQQPSSISECKRLYDERRYVEARNCFSQILTQDPKNVEAQTYYRLSNKLPLGIPKSENSSHSPGTPEIPALQSLVQEALQNDPELHRIQQEVEGIQSREAGGLTNDSSLESVRLAIPYFYPCRWNASSSWDAANPELQRQLAAPLLQWWESLLQSRKNELVSQVKKSYIRLFSVRQEFLIHDQHRRYLSDNQRIALARYRQSQVTQDFLLGVQREETQGIEDLIQLEKKEALARASLNSFLNRDPALLVRLPEFVEVPEFSWDLRQLENLASVNRPELRAANACLQNALLWMKATGSGDKESYLFKSEEHGAEAVETGIKREVHEAFIIADNGYRLLRFCETTLIPQVETALLSSQASYRGGEGNYDQLTKSQRQLTSSKVRKVTAQSEYLTGLAELERAVGVSLEKRDSGNSFKRNPSTPE